MPHLTVPEPTLGQHEKGCILAQVEMLEQAIVALLDCRLDRELRGRARREAHELAGSLETLGLTCGAQLARGIERMLTGKMPFAEALILQLAESVIALRENVERESEKNHSLEP